MKWRILAHIERAGVKIALMHTVVGLVPTLKRYIHGRPVNVKHDARCVMVTDKYVQGLKWGTKRDSRAERAKKIVAYPHFSKRGVKRKSVGPGADPGVQAVSPQVT